MRRTAHAMLARLRGRGVPALTLGAALVAAVVVALVGGFSGHRADAVSDPVIAAAGDIACDPANSSFNGGAGSSNSCRQRYTSDLLVNAGLSAVLDLGDNAYYCGSQQSFQQSYDPSWGRVKSITRPAVGNHEYLTHGGTSGASGCDSSNAGAAGYFSYFGSAAGQKGQGYYSYDIGAWHLIALNSNCGDAGGCSSSSPQGRWLQNDLASHQNACTLAYWHIPLFSSGGRANGNTQTFWNMLYNADADLILTGHDHIYERFAPQTPTGAADATRGIREFVVGTGGANHTSLGTIFANSQVRNTSAFGVLKVTLHPTSYDWSFQSAAGSSFTDSGTTACHGAGSTAQPPTNTAVPTVSGQTQQGQALTGTDGTWTSPTPITYTRQWRSCDTAGNGCTDISGATANAYTLTTGDIGKTIRFRVTAANADGSSVADSTATGVITAAPTPPVNATPPLITGTTEVGATLTTTNGTWSGNPPPSYAYQWQSCPSAGACANVGQNSSSYLLAPSDTGNTVRVIVTATNSAGSDTATSAPTQAVTTPQQGTPPSYTQPPQIAGTTQVGQILTGSQGTWNGNPPPTFTYRWLSCDSLGTNCSPIAGATGTTYTLVDSDLNKRMRFEVTAQNSAGSVTLPSDASTPVDPPPAPTLSTAPAITGSAVVPQTLTATTGTWSGNPTSYAYQWKGCDTAGNGCADIAGETGPSHTLTTADVGKTIRVQVVASNAGGPSQPALSTQTAVVTSGSPPATFAFAPVADSYVQSDVPTKNNGTSTQFRVDASPTVNSYLRFNVTGLTGPVARATLMIWANSAQSTGFDVFNVADNTWTETGITWNNAPPFAGSKTGSSGAVVSSTWKSVDVTSLVAGNGPVNLGLSTTNVTALSLASRESGANAPQLVVETAGS